jgi:hypothetical protein
MARFKKFLFATSAIILILIGTFIWINEQRLYFQIGNENFTVWKTWGGKCYFIPKIYRGLFYPDTNYFTASNVANVSIYIAKGKTGIFIYSLEDYHNAISSGNYSFFVPKNFGDDEFEAELWARNSFAMMLIDLRTCSIYHSENCKELSRAECRTK